MNEILADKLKNLPARPGVYLYRNKDGKILYVGKAKVLRNRVRSYFQDSRNLHPRTQLMISLIHDLETIIVDSEVEALILESNLIKEHRPRFNILLRDDKSYPYIRITNEPFPQVFVTRRIVRDGSRYLGPYTDVKHLRSIVRAMQKIFPIRSCKFYLDKEVVEKRKVKLCLEYHIKRCEGPCEGLVDSKHYRKMINQVERFLKGKTRELLEELNQLMLEKSEATHFEEAARIRDQIKMIKEYDFMPRRVTLSDELDRDVIALAHEGEDACVVVFKIRDGKVIGRQHFYLDGVDQQETPEILHDFLQQFYLEADYYPPQILLPMEPSEEKELLETWLSEKAEQKVELLVPQIGSKKKLVQMCQTNARFLMEELQIQRLKNKDHVPFSVRELQKHLSLENPPRRIEGFDISNIQGTDAVASMVCFIDGRPRKSEYRIFKIRSKQTPDDFLMMHEAVSRRYRRQLVEKQALPDLILVDGGKGQLSSAVRALREVGVPDDQPIIGLAKRLEEVFLPSYSDPMNIPKRSSGLKLLQQVRDEAHRFAITHFRKQHKKTVLKSPLDDIEGIGPARKKHLLRTFGSLKKISQVDVETLQKQGKLPEKVAQNLIQALQEKESATRNGQT